VFQEGAPILPQRFGRFLDRAGSWPFRTASWLNHQLHVTDKSRDPIADRAKK
jgi:hypothetical protein